MIKKANKEKQIELFILKIDGKEQGRFTNETRCTAYKNGYLHALQEFKLIEGCTEDYYYIKEDNYTYYIVNVTLIKNKEG